MWILLKTFLDSEKKSEAQEKFDSDYESFQSNSEVEISEEEFAKIYNEYFENKEKYDSLFSKTKEPKIEGEKTPRELSGVPKDKKAKEPKLNIKNLVLKFLYNQYGNKPAKVEPVKEEVKLGVLEEYDRL